MNVLVLGASGMLGGMVYHYLKDRPGMNVLGTSRRPCEGMIHFDVYDGFKDAAIDLKKIEYVINCIGVTRPYCRDDNMKEVKSAIHINSIFPHMLSDLAEKFGFKVIQISTDCVYSGRRGGYSEDAVHDAIDTYGRTKSLGEIRSRSFLNIRCSIIGPERFSKIFLLEWFLSHPKGSNINGFSNQLWNGVTTLQFARLCEAVIRGKKFDPLIRESSVHHFVPNDAMTKYDLLRLFNKIFDRGLVINKAKGPGGFIDHTLNTSYSTIQSFYPKSTIEDGLKELKRYMEENDFYKEKRIGRFRRRDTCRFCQGEDLATILDLGNMPLAGGFLKEGGFSSEKLYPLELKFCKSCSLVQITNVVPAEDLFKNYFYFSSSIKTLVDHMASFAGETRERFLKTLKRPSVFELGCNDGVLLKPFASMGVKAVGVDPATNVVNSIDSKEITVINDFFTEKLAIKIRKNYGPFDAFLSSYSFAHIDDMTSVMKGVRHILKDEGVFIFEIYYLGTLIDKMQYDMIYHEHLSYYSLKALNAFLNRFGMEIFDVKFIPGVRAGAVRFYAKNIGKRKETVSDAVRKLARYEKRKGFEKVETYLNYAGKIEDARKELLSMLRDLKEEGKTIVGYGASGRSTTIMNYCGIDSRYLDYVIDDAEAKHGFFTPGTHLSIRPWDFTAKSALPDYALLFAWSFIDEVRRRRSDYLAKGGKFIVPLPKVKIISK
jgi:dTDP-4-dehydrorhamnose reductase/SAM-dependent methyltransferase